MFGFGKKKLDARTLGSIAIELAMFMRWVETNRNRMVLPEEALDITRRILAREGLNGDDGEVRTIVNAAIASDVDPVDQFRKETKFDQQIDGFCRSIGIRKP